ncbi:hypothetical protein A5780_33740 [Nocardia sp. 852002-20019_SCH5090214]|nr:hypothetical protein A5780_33740 [Nocardia sp. 852002-20019_SCH5090214]
MGEAIVEAASQRRPASGRAVEITDSRRDRTRKVLLGALFSGGVTVGAGGASVVVGHVLGGPPHRKVGDQVAVGRE